MPSIGSVASKYSNKNAQGEIIPEGYSRGRLKDYTPEQMKLHESQFQHLGPDSYLSRLAGGDQSMFEEMEAPAMRQFQGLQGQLASRFSGMGMGGRKSSSFQNESNQATSDFAQGLQSKRMELRNQAIRDLMGMSNTLLGQKPYKNFLVDDQQGGEFGIPGAIMGGIAGFGFGGPAGAAKGAQWGHQIGSSI